MEKIKNNFNACYMGYECIIEDRKYCKYFEKNDALNNCDWYHDKLKICTNSKANTEALLDEIEDELIDNYYLDATCEIRFICKNRDPGCDCYEDDKFTGDCTHKNIVKDTCQNKQVIKKELVHYLKLILNNRKEV